MLGSTQRSDVVDAVRATERGVAVVRRRGGGGAVLLRPGDHLWIEAWIPRGDPLWEADVAVAAEWVGAWWREALDPDGDGARGLAVHHGRAVPGPHGDLVCFSGRGPGEVFLADRKVMGISQWRSREGSLFHTCAYAHWDPRPLIDLLDVGSPRREALLRDLPQAATGILDPGPTSLPVLPGALPRAPRAARNAPHNVRHLGKGADLPAPSDPPGPARPRPAPARPPPGPPDHRSISEVSFPLVPGRRPSAPSRIFPGGR